MFVTTDAGVVAFDPIGVDAARQLAAEIRRTAPGSPLAAIVYSHSDADHATGAGALMEAMGQTGVPIIAHELAVAPIEARGSADQPAPSVTFADKFRFLMGERWIELHYLGPSHTDNIAVPFIPDAGVAFAVDFASNDPTGVPVTSPAGTSRSSSTRCRVCSESRSRRSSSAMGRPVTEPPSSARLRTTMT